MQTEIFSYFNSNSEVQVAQVSQEMRRIVSEARCLKKSLQIKPDQNVLAILNLHLSNMHQESQLEHLDLSGCRITPDILTFISTYFPHLKSLKLEDSSITDTDLEHVKRLTQLKSLTIRECGEIKNDHLAHLTNLTQLESLTIWHCKDITAIAFEYLKILLPNLSHSSFCPKK